MAPKRKKNSPPPASSTSSKKVKKPVNVSKPAAKASAPKSTTSKLKKDNNISSDDAGANPELPENDGEYTERSKSKSVRAVVAKPLGPPLSTRSRKTKEAALEESAEDEDAMSLDNDDSPSSEEEEAPTPPRKKVSSNKQTKSQNDAAPRKKKGSSAKAARVVQSEVSSSNGSEEPMDGESEDEEAPSSKTKKGKRTKPPRSRRTPVQKEMNSEDESYSVSDVEEGPAPSQEERRANANPKGARTASKGKSRARPVSTHEESDPDDEEDGVGKAVDAESDGDATLKSQHASEEEGEYLEEYGMLRIRKLPARCAVSQEDIMDEILLDHGSYNGLHNLKEGKCAPYNEAYPAMGEGGLLPFHMWKGQAPKMSTKVAASFMSFAREGRYINLARVHPFQVFGRLMPNSTSTWELVVREGRSYQQALCITPVGISESHTLKPADNVSSTSISGYHHEHEFDRMMGLLCMLCDTSTVHVRLFKNALTFMAQAPRVTNTPGSAFGNMFAAGSSPLRGSRSKVDTSKGGPDSLLPHNARIPVYDARKKKNLKITASLLKNPGQLPMLDSELRAGSFAIICHTGSITKKVTDNVDKWSFFAAPQWIIVLGEPA